jgi:hypothetical protein
VVDDILNRPKVDIKSLQSRGVGSDIAKDGIFLTEPYTATIGMDTKIVKDSSMKFIS